MDPDELDDLHDFVRRELEDHPPGTGSAGWVEPEPRAPTPLGPRGSDPWWRARWSVATRRIRSSVPAVVILTGLGLAVWVNGPGSAALGQWGGSRRAGGVLQVGRPDAPTPAPAPSRSPLGAPRATGATGPHVFFATQEGSGRPVTYDPCRPIRYVVNDRSAPPLARQLVHQAVGEISAATGLQFEFEGPTDEKGAGDRPAFQPERYGDRWAPVLIEWSDEVSSPALLGPVAGVGGSTTIGGGDLLVDVYVSGAVTLDAPQLGEIIDRSGRGAEQVQSVIVHELAHLVGLAHVDDPTQLMHAESSTVTELQHGDLAGLAELGRGTCISRL